MNDEEFLRTVLNDLEPPQSQVDSLLRLRDNIRSCIFEHIGGEKSMFMAGSFKKDTMIRQHYDLDMFIIWTSEFMPLKDLFYEVKRALLNFKWKRLEKKRVGWRIPYENEFHVDVIPSVQDTHESEYSYLYNCFRKKRLKTSMQKHIEEIEKYDRRDVIKLLKLWKFRREVPIKTFLLEIITHLACYNVTRDSLSIQLKTIFEYILNNIVNKEFYDPANRDNIISEDLTRSEKYEIRDKVYKALNCIYWGQIFENIG
ncbi:hypothetical protein LCGC14_0975420 [marine sediment metagenome]|uniref:Polymerase nucleotidyl transferase domain-containing protein n=1 Tax=marine sediment metagenome TaxID=412755 RepID=A0A0F9NWL8_9ZZZZ|nr:nucleotidyltransferase [bacterium]